MKSQINWVMVLTRLISVVSTLIVCFLIIEPAYNTCTSKAKANHIIMNGEACKQIVERQVSVDLENLCQKAYRESFISVRECTVKTMFHYTSSFIRTIFIGEIYNEWFYRVVGLITCIMLLVGFYKTMLICFGLEFQQQERVMNLRFQPDMPFVRRRLIEE